MTFQQELSSWFAPKHSAAIAAAPTLGSPAPPTPAALDLQRRGRPTVLAFLRHCGCPWAEKTYVSLRRAAGRHPDVDFVAVSHSSEADTAEWVASLPRPAAKGEGKGEPGNLRLVVDDKAEAYAAWGLGVASWTHVLSLPAMWEVYKVARDEGIKNRPTRSGSRWQRSGLFGVDAEGVVRWGRLMERADEILDLEEGARAVKAGGDGMTREGAKL